MVYKTKGTCSSEIEFEVENGILQISILLVDVREIQLVSLH